MSPASTGFRLKSLRVHLEGEIGRNDNASPRSALRNYHAIRSRIQYRTRTLTIGGSYQENYNNNSIVDYGLQSRARDVFGGRSWTAKPWLSLDASYSKLHLDTIGGIAFFAGAPRAVKSRPDSRFTSATSTRRIWDAVCRSTKRADLYVGYNITKDTGDGRTDSGGSGRPGYAGVL